jgi:hypothetical protein
MVEQQVQNNADLTAMPVTEAPVATPQAGASRERGGRQRQSKVSLNSSQMDPSAASQTFMKIGGLTINLDNIHICTYTCDFGNVVIGKSKVRSFRLTNVGKMPINFTFDKKLLGQAGIVIDQDKGQKIMPATSQLFTVTFTSRKNSKFGRVSFKIPIEIKNGPSYTIDFIANITVPELSMSTDNLDFERVLVNTRKTVKLRIEN